MVGDFVRGGNRLVAFTLFKIGQCDFSEALENIPPLQLFLVILASLNNGLVCQTFGAEMHSFKEVVSIDEFLTGLIAMATGSVKIGFIT